MDIKLWAWLLEIWLINCRVGCRLHKNVCGVLVNIKELISMLSRSSVPGDTAPSAAAACRASRPAT